MKEHNFSNTLSQLENTPYLDKIIGELIELTSEHSELTNEIIAIHYRYKPLDMLIATALHNRSEVDEKEAKELFNNLDIDYKKTFLRHIGVNQGFYSIIMEHSVKNAFLLYTMKDSNFVSYGKMIVNCLDLDQQYISEIHHNFPQTNTTGKVDLGDKGLLSFLKIVKKIKMEKSIDNLLFDSVEYYDLVNFFNLNNCTHIISYNEYSWGNFNDRIDSIEKLNLDYRFDTWIGNEGLTFDFHISKIYEHITQINQYIIKERHDNIKDSLILAGSFVPILGQLKDIGEFLINMIKRNSNRPFLSKLYKNFISSEETKFFSYYSKVVRGILAETLQKNNLNSINISNTELDENFNLFIRALDKNKDSYFEEGILKLQSKMTKRDAYSLMILGRNLGKSSEEIVKEFISNRI